jgi:hypothetical protein
MCVSLFISFSDSTGSSFPFPSTEKSDSVTMQQYFPFHFGKSFFFVIVIAHRQFSDFIFSCFSLFKKAKGNMRELLAHTNAGE